MTNFIHQYIFMYLSAKDKDIKHFLLFMYFSRHDIIIADDCVLIIENLVVCALRKFKKMFFS